MKYTGEITNKDVIDGVLVIQLRYTSEDRSKIIQDSVTTKVAQDDNWITNIILQKCKELEDLDNFSDNINIGEIEVNSVKPVETNPVDLAKETYKQDLSTFNKMVSVFRQGLISQYDEAFVSLQKKLKDNFKPEYLDLF